MSNLFAIVSGLVQGLTEFLPVSSSGHLTILRGFFGLDFEALDGLTFEVMLHLATLAAVVIVYHGDVFTLVCSFFSLVKKLLCRRLSDGLSDGEKFVVRLLLATLPMVLLLPVKDRVEVLYSGVRLTGVMLILNAVMLFLSDRAAKRNYGRLEDMKPKNALAVGFFQLTAALFPGLSRSGTTVTGGLTQGLDRENAVRFSFIMSIPAILGANITELPGLFASPIPSSDVMPLMLGMAAAFLSGLFAIGLLRYIAKRSSFRPFSYYCAALGLIVLIFA